MFTWSSLLALTIFFFYYNKLIELVSSLEVADPLPNDFVEYSYSDDMSVDIRLNTLYHPTTRDNICYMTLIAPHILQPYTYEICVKSSLPDCVYKKVLCSNFAKSVVFDAFNQKTNYLSITMMRSDGNPKAQHSREEIYGFEIPFIMKPMFELNFRDSTVTLQLRVCQDIRCALKYEGEVYFQSDTQSCGTLFIDGLNELNYMIPSYILECISYPIILLNTSTQAFKEISRLNRREFDVYYDKEGNNHLYTIELKGYYSNEICYFAYKSGTTRQRFYHRVNFMSSCSIDKPNEPCYAPCNKVSLIAQSNELTTIVVLIESRHRFSTHKGTVHPKDYYTKNVLIREGTSQTLFIQQDGDVFFNMQMLRSTFRYLDIGSLIIFHVPYYKMAKPFKSIEEIFCYERNDLKTAIECNSQVDIIKPVGLPAGTPILLKIRRGSGNGEYVTTYIVTDPLPSDRFDHEGAKAVGSTIEIKAVKEHPQTLSESTPPTCIYYLRQTSKNLFTEANCGNNLCRGLCRDPQKIIGLDYNITYDVMVIANEIHGSYTYKSILTDVKPKIVVTTDNSSSVTTDNSSSVTTDNSSSVTIDNSSSVTTDNSSSVTIEDSSATKSSLSSKKIIIIVSVVVGIVVCIVAGVLLYFLWWKKKTLEDIL